MSGAPAGRGEEPATSGFEASILAGLAAGPPTIEAKWLYDARGSALFDAITRLPEYYPTRTELAILRDHGAEIAAGLPPGAVLFEPGAGTGGKAAILLAAMDRPAAYLPADINVEHLRGALPEGLGVPVRPLAMDFTASMRLPGDLPGPVAAFFPGSTIGNFEPGPAGELLSRFRTEAGAASLVIGFDFVKDRETLEAAYDDAAGVTAAFNLNLLARINRELGADFDAAAFRHVAPWNAERSRVEMNLESLADQTVQVAGRPFRFRAGERIRTEHSYKHTLDGFRALAAEAGWHGGRVWTDPREWFAVGLFRAEGAAA